MYTISSRSFRRVANRLVREVHGGVISGTPSTPIIDRRHVFGKWEGSDVEIFEKRIIRDKI